MTEKEYFAQIKEIRKHILSNRLDRAEELLEKMYIYKQVRLLSVSYTKLKLPTTPYV